MGGVQPDFPIPAPDFAKIGIGKAWETLNDFKTSGKVSNVSGILPISVRLRFKQHLALCWCEGGGRPVQFPKYVL